METNDFINGAFEFLGSMAGWVNVVKLYKDKKVRGVYWPAMFFFTLWGFWNVYYYPTLHQTASFVGGIFMSMASVVWLIMATKYRNNQ
jgi:hypothetical protein